MVSGNDEHLGSYAALVVIALVGAVLTALAFVPGLGVPEQVTLLAVGSSLIAAAAVVLAERALPERSQKNILLKDHWRIYEEFGKMIDRLDPEEPHEIRTINSFPPHTESGRQWDIKVVEFLRRNPHSSFVRVILDDGSSAWKERMGLIGERYVGFENYHQHRVDQSTMPAMEMFLIDRSEVLLSFANSEGKSQPISFGVKIRNPVLCRQLQAYHRAQLELKIPREELRRKT